jgi:hypothetical protein
LNPELADPTPDGMFPTAKEGTMAEAKLAPNLPDWMIEHANRYLASGGTDGHMYKITVPRRGEITAPALLLTTTGRTIALGGPLAQNPFQAQNENCWRGCPRWVILD